MLLGTSKIFLVICLERLIVALIVCVLASDVLAQTNFINTYQYNDSLATVFYGVHSNPENDTLIVSGISYQCLENGNCYQGFYLAKMDTHGSIISDTVIYALGDDIYAENIRILHPASDNGYFIAGQYISKRNGLVIKVDKEFRVDFIKEYPENPNSILTVRNRGIRQIGDHYYLLSIKQHANFRNYTHLMKLKSNGDLIWDKAFIREGSASAKFDISLDGNLNIFGQLGKDTTDNKIAYKQWFMKVDTSGSILNEYQSDWMINGEAGFYDLLELPDSYIISTSNFYYDPAWNDYPLYQILLKKLNRDFETVWSLKYGDTSSLNGINNIIHAGNNSFIATGIYTPPPGIEFHSATAVLTFKFNSDGMIIWQRLDSIFYEPVHGSQNYTGESIILNSGSIMTSGYLETGFPNQKTLGFLMKVDSDGCIEPGCHNIVGLNETVIDETLLIYPNPVRDHLIIHTPVNLPSLGGQFIIFNELGEIVFQEKLDSRIGINYITTSFLIPGHYSVLIKIENKIYRNSFIKL